MRRAGAFVLAAALTGCAIPNQTLTPDEENQLAPIACEGAKQCGDMWQRAQLWIAQRAAMKLQLVTDVVLQTHTDPEQHGTRLSYTVTKEPVGGDRYLMNSTAGCRNMFGCHPHPNKGRAALHRFIRETPQ